MADLISNVTTVFTAAVGWMGTVATTVTSTPVLLLGVVTGFVGLGIGMFKRLLSV